MHTMVCRAATYYDHTVPGASVAAVAVMTEFCRVHTARGLRPNTLINGRRKSTRQCLFS